VHFIIIGLLLGIGLMLAPYVLGAVQLAIAWPMMREEPRKYREKKKEANPYARAEADIQERARINPWK
jgi:hypothetical protein